MGNRQFFPALTSLFALACCLATLTYLITLNAGIMGTYYPQVLLVYAPLLYGINRLFLRKERSMLSITALNGGLWIALVASICILEWDSGIAALVFAAIFTLIATNQGVNLFIPFVPITVMLSFALGLDSLVGVSIILLGGAVGFSFA